MRVLVTGSRGFIGKNLLIRLSEQPNTEVLEFTRDDSVELLPSLVAQADAIVHLAGESRPEDVASFARSNSDLTNSLCFAIRGSGQIRPLILASSTQATQENLYGISKKGAERAVELLAAETGNPVAIYRLPGVFGKWCKPNYNSVVATFCHNIANDLPIRVNDPAVSVRLVYVDDVVTDFLRALDAMVEGVMWRTVAPEYSITLGALSRQIEAFKNCRNTLISERVGSGLTRALYATYMSYLPPQKFSYNIPCHDDPRGLFVEMLKTPDCGQFSYFTARPGVTRGEHYHHSKTEKFLVIKGSARFCFRHITTGEKYELITRGGESKIVETVPGWTHNITNIGDDEMIVMLWANEIFDRQHPDTFAMKVTP